MRNSRSNITEKTISSNKTKHFTKMRLTVIASFVLAAMVNVLAFSSTAFAQQTQSMQVTIDVMPGVSENNVSLGTSYAIPVAILSSGAFNPATVNPETLTLAGGPASKDDDEKLFSLKDVNGDGVQDMLVYFAADYTELNGNSTEVILKGFTSDGVPLQGMDYVRCTAVQAGTLEQNLYKGNGVGYAMIRFNPGFVIGYTEVIYNYVASFFSPEPTPVTAAPVVDTVSEFSNTASIAVPNRGTPAQNFTSGRSNPYPSQITVSNVGGNVKKVTATIKGLSHSSPDDIDVLLVGPEGQKLLLMSDTGGPHDITGLTLTFDDSVINSLPDNPSTAFSSGTYKPTNFGSPDDNFASTTGLSGSYQQTPNNTLLNVFNGKNPNGVWNLYVIDDTTQDIGAILEGWSLTITTEQTDTTAPTLTLPSNITAEATSASGAAVTYTATATDANPASPTVNCNPTSGSTFAIATTTVNCSATDDYNNTANGSFTVKVQDTTVPVISTSNQSADATSASGAAVTFTGISAADTVDSTPGLSFSPASGSTFPIGTTEVTVTAKDDYNNTATAKFNVTVNKLSTSIIGLTNPTVITYGQPVPQTASVQGGPANAIIAYTIASGHNVAANSNSFGSISNPLAVGDYTLRADYAGDNTYSGSVKAVNVTVNKANATIALSNLMHTYDGSAKSATATTNPASLSVVSVTYNGSATAPTNAGSYPVVATLNNANYKLVNGSGQEISQVAGTLVINKAAATLALVRTDLNQTYNGSAKTVGYTINPTTVTGVSVTYNNSTTAPTNAGSYAIVASLTNHNYEAPNATGTLIIAKAAATISLSNLTHTYDGSTKSAAATTDPAGLSSVSITYDGSANAPANAGSYTVVASLTNDNYEAPNKTGTMVISKADQVIAWSNPTAITYGTALGAEQLNASLTNGNGALTYSPAAGTIPNAGTRTLRVDAAETDNYKSAFKEVSLTVNKATAGVVLSNLEQTYDGSAKSATAATTPADLSGVAITYNGSAAAPTNAGSYAVAATLTNDNYELPEVNGVRQATGTLVIKKATPTIAWSNPSDIIYGTALSGTQLNAASSVAAGNLVYTPAAGTVLNAGNGQTLSVGFTPTDTTNYENASKTVTINVLKATPVITWNNPAQIFYGTKLSDTQLNAAASVPGNRVYTPPAGTLLSPGLNQPLKVDFTPTDSSNYNNTSKTVGIDVVNDKPVITSFTSPSAPVQVNTAITFSAAFTDQGEFDTHTAVWNWGDGVLCSATNSCAGTVTEPGTSASGSVGGSHKYTVPGVYTVTLTVTDFNGASDTKSITEYIVIYDPNGGFVTGGGWFDSPAGASVEYPSAIGKANFGFVSKYQKGAAVPTGETEFQFKAGNLKFNSTSYEWLTIAGARAQYKGKGTINGTGNYQFLLTAIDGLVNGGGNVDKFRMKIMNADGTVVYDNQMGMDDAGNPTTAIGGGSIVIHSK